VPDNALSGNEVSTVTR